MACCGQRVRRYTFEDPLIFGDPLGSPVHVESTVSLRGIPRGVTAWVDGTGVQPLLDSGFLRPA